MASRINELELYSSTRGEDGQLMDWSKAASSLTSGLAVASGMRQLRRTENEQFKKSAEDEITKQLDLADDSSKKFITFGADAGRAQINKLYDDMKNGRISRTQYKASTGNIKDKWTDVSDLFKNMDSIYVKALENQENGTASEIEIGVIDYYGRLNDLGNKALSFDDNGNISVAIFNDQGKPIEYQNVSDFKNLMNTQFNKVDLYGMADVATKNLATNKKYNVTDIRVFHPEVYDGARKTFQNTVLSDGRSVASILVDYGGYGFYFSDADKQNALDRLKQKRPDATEADLVLLKQGEKGRITYDPTPDQLKKAQDIVGNEFDARFGREVDYTPWAGSSGNSGDGDKEEELNTRAKTGYIATLEAFGYDPQRFINNNEVTYTRGRGGSVMNNFSGLDRNYTYEKNPSGYIDVYKIGETEPFFTAKMPSDLRNFAYGTADPSKAEVFHANARKLLGVDNRGKASYNPKKKVTPSPKGSANNFLNQATTGGVDYSKFD